MMGDFRGCGQMDDFGFGGDAFGSGFGGGSQPPPMATGPSLQGPPLQGPSLQGPAMQGMARLCSTALYLWFACRKILEEICLAQVMAGDNIKMLP